MTDRNQSTVTIPAGTLLDAWDAMLEASPGERGLLLLSVAYPELPVATLATWTVGRRDAALLALRERVFGPRLAVLADCPRCDEALEMEFPVSAITVPAPEDRSDRFGLDHTGYRVIYRLPTAGDLAALGQARMDRNGGQEPARWLLERCVIRVDAVGEETDDRGPRPGRSARTAIADAAVMNGGERATTTSAAPSGSASAVPDAVLEAVAAALAESVAVADPQAEIELSLTCPACQLAWQATFDIVSFLCEELEAWVGRLLSDVHILATTYGWREQDILALSPWRRERYLELIGA